MDELNIKQIDYKTAMNVVVAKHYLHRKCPCTMAFGLFELDELVGVIVFGKPASYTLCNGIAGNDESKNVMEFNRLWVDDRMPKNTESWFISRAMKQFPFEIIVSFADTEQGHIGYIYQATNWLYCGESKRQKYFRVKRCSKNIGGAKYRRRVRMAKEKIIELYGWSFVEEYYSSLKHRYIYFNCTKQRRKELLKKLKYEIQPYPKFQKIKKEDKKRDVSSGSNKLLEILMESLSD